MILTLAGLSQGVGTALAVIAGILGFAIVFLFTFASVLVRTHEIGILRALGASTGYILGILMREALFLAVVGTITGIAATYGSSALIHRFVPSMTIQIVKAWWTPVALISFAGSLVGTIFPGLRAAREQAMEALDYD